MLEDIDILSQKYYNRCTTITTQSLFYIFIGRTKIYIRNGMIPYDIQSLDGQDWINRFSNFLPYVLYRYQSYTRPNASTGRRFYDYYTCSRYKI